ncbi:MAG: VWA domain-containing protein [Polyangiaceae bacterium]|nr:VWA domain-containing protein [Polyangiaceae bacterium]
MAARLAAALVVALVLLGAVACGQKAPGKAPPIQARLELAAGPVTVDVGTGPARAVTGTALLADARIATEKGARALVRLPDGSALFLRDQSAVKLADGKVALESGEYWLDAPPTDRQALAHEAGGVTVSGAECGLSFRREGDGATVYVARGMATVTSQGGRVEVKAGEQASVAGGAAPKVAPVAFWDDWTGGMADAGGKGLPGAGSGSIYGVDSAAPPGSAARRLEIQKQVVTAKVREGLSQTSVDQTFFNPGDRPVEGWYWFTVPERASVTGFAVETNGVLVEGEFQERREAAANYSTAKATGHAPAILEWVDARTYRARIYPVPAGGTRRVVLRYLELRPAVDGRLSYTYPMGSSRDPVRIGEFSLSVDLGPAGKKAKLATLADARVEEGGTKVTMRRSGYTPRADFQLELESSERLPPLTVARYQAGGESADYVLFRYRPDVDWAKAKQQRADVVVVVDTSAGGDEASRQLRTQTAEAILRALSDEDRFALVSLDVKPTVLHPKDGMAPASDAEIAKALEALAGHAVGGATDLAAAFEPSLARVHGTEQPAVIYVGDGIATSGERTGEQLVERLRRALASSRARLFTVGVGVEADHALLGELARAGGGGSFRVDDAEATTARALEVAAAVKVPTVTDLEIDPGAGLDEPLLSASGKVARGEEVLLLARTHFDTPGRVKVRGRVGGEAFEKEYGVEKEKSVLASFVPRLWAAEYVRRLLGSAQGAEAERGRIAALGIDYGLLTPYSSILALESESAYARMGIVRKRRPLRGAELTRLDPREEGRLVEMLHASAPCAVAFGCSKLERRRQAAPTTEALEEQEADNKEGGSGIRAKAEEGSMGNPSSPRAANAYATPQAAPARAEDSYDKGDDRPAPPPGEVTGGLGLSAAGEGGGGVGDPLGAIGTIGHGAGTGVGQGFGAGSGRAPTGARAGGGDQAAARPAPADEKQKQVDDSLRQAADAAARAALERAARARRIVDRPLGTCSDMAERPLAQRVLLWRARLRTARTPGELIERYEGARRACELPDWLAERTFLDLLQQRIQDPGAVTAVLAHFSGRPEVQKHVAKLILRRAVSDAMVTAVERVLFGSAVVWNDVDNKLAAIEDVEKRLEKLREFIAKAPEDPNGQIRLVRLLSLAGKKDEALVVGRRLRDSGLLGPMIAQRLGDALARAGEGDEAVRTYSEIVEFDPEGVAPRRLLGDVYLGHGWYEPAYRQYRTITELAPEDALGWLRLAAAAAGTGRVDEALRLERQVANAQGVPGASDPRRWAKLMSAARLARLLHEPAAPVAGQPPVDPAKRAAAMERELKELQLLSGPGTLVVLTWEALDASVELVARVGGKELALGEVTDAAPVGLQAVVAATAELASASLHARLRTPRRDDPTPLLRHDLVWDGKKFTVAVRKVELPAGTFEIAL